MSTLHQSRGRADADTAKGELRKPDDYSSQPGQGEAEDRHGKPGRAASAGPEAGAGAVGKSPREYAHSSGDRNTMRDARDWHRFEGGTQRDATPDAPLDPARRPDPVPKRGGGPSDTRSGRRS